MACQSFQAEFFALEASSPPHPCVLFQGCTNIRRADEVKPGWLSVLVVCGAASVGETGGSRNLLSGSFTTEPEAALLAYGSVKGCVKIQTNLGGCGEVMTAAQTLLCIKLRMQVLASQ